MDLDPVTRATDAAEADDDDGIPDGADNCPAQSNGDQHDEDADGVGDVCDRCPHLIGDQQDEDADGVGDACDPRPTTGGDRISFFDGFAGDMLASGWQLIGPKVSVTGDQLVFSARSANLRLLRPAAGVGEVTTLLARVHLTAYPTPPTFPDTGYRMLPPCCHASCYGPEQDGAKRTLSSRNRSNMVPCMTHH